MSDSSAAENQTRSRAAGALDPALAGEQARTLLASMNSFLASADRLSARIRVAVTIPVGLMCILGWGLLSAFGSVFMGQARHPVLMLAGGIVLLLIGLHGATRHGTRQIPATLLATIVTLIYGTAVLMNGLLATIFLGAIVIAVHVVTPPRSALLLSLAALIATPPLLWWATAGQLNLPHVFRVMMTGVMAITFLQLLCRANVRFKAEALRVARGLEALMTPLNASLEQALRDRERAEQALASAQAADARLMELKAQLEDAVGSMSQGLVMVDALGRVALCNPQARGMLGLSQGQLDSHALFTDVLELQAERGELAREADAPEPTSSAVVARPDQRDVVVDGAVRRTVNTRAGHHLEMSTRRMHSGYTVHTYTDVSDYVHANEQLRTTMLGLTMAKEQLNTELSRARRESDMKLKFVASVSHEIRTPLNGIVGMFDLIEHGGLDERQTELLADVKTSTRQLRKLTDDILDLSHLKHATFSLALAPLDLTALVDKVVRAAQGAAQQTGLRLELLMRDSPCPVIGDAQRLQQILNNLIYNAIKFTAQGAVRVHVEWRYSDTDGAVEAVISIADSGRGITPAALNSIFEPFHQGDESTNRNYGGTGLGLALCRELCEAMGGSIRAASRLGHGSVFTVMVRLPRAEHDLDFEDTQPASLDECAWSLAGKRVLVVDDNRINQKLLCIWLTEAGARFQVAKDGAEGLRAASAELFDGILMDVSMPVMNGLDATRAIRLLARSGDARLTRLASVPIIGVTAMAQHEDLRLCLEAGMDAHLSKPLQRGKLLRTLNEVIDAENWLHNVSTGGHPRGLESTAPDPRNP